MKLLIFITLLLTTTDVALALEGYDPIVSIPGTESSSGVEELINALYALSIAIAALLAVIKIVIAGMKWMLTDVVPTKDEAKREMTGALTGLLVILSAVLILNVINPNLTKVDLSFGSGGGAAPANSNNNGNNGGANAPAPTPGTYCAYCARSAAQETIDQLKATCDAIPGAKYQFEAASNQHRCYNEDPKNGGPLPANATVSVVVPRGKCAGDNVDAISGECTKPESEFRREAQLDCGLKHYLIPDPEYTITDKTDENYPGHYLCYKNLP